MTKYCFRLNFRMVTGLDLTTQPTDLVLPMLPFLSTIATNEPRAPGVDQWVTIRSCGHPSQEEAKAQALRLKDIILLAGATGFGADFGTGDNVRSGLSDEIKRSIKDQFATIIRDEVHGIDIFEEGDVRHFRVTAHATVQMDLSQFSKHVAEAGTLPDLTPITRTGLELLNDSLFPMPDEARLLLRISAIEALCEQTERPQPVQDLINKLLGAVHSHTDSSAADAMNKVLNEARRQSVRQACLSKIRMRLGDEAAKDFDQLYALRSQYVHEGRGRGSLSAPAAEAWQIAKALLLAEIKGAVAGSSDR